MKVPVRNEDRQKSYFKYYQMEMAPLPEDKLQWIANGKSDPKDALTIHHRTELFDGGYLPGEFGYWLLEDGTAMTACLTDMPGVTADMFDWWFVWHPLDRLRYAIWDSDDHFDVYLDDASPARDKSKSYRERNWGSVHHVWEDIGAGFGLLDIYFKKPSDFGYDMSRIGTEACATIVCSNARALGSDSLPDVPAVMTHFLRPTAQGSELRSRFWLGWNIAEGEPVKLLPDGLTIPESVPRELLRHNLKEFCNLAKILPAVYAEEWRSDF